MAIRASTAFAARVARGFAELARSGVEGVRVEVLAKNLGVTKGGFYRRFRDRAALLDAMRPGLSAALVNLWPKAMLHLAHCLRRAGLLAQAQLILQATRPGPAPDGWRAAQVATAARAEVKLCCRSEAVMQK